MSADQAQSDQPPLIFGDRILDNGFDFDFDFNTSLENAAPVDYFLRQNLDRASGYDFDAEDENEEPQAETLRSQQAPDVLQAQHLVEDLLSDADADGESCDDVDESSDEEQQLYDSLRTDYEQELPAAESLTMHREADKIFRWANVPLFGAGKPSIVVEVTALQGDYINRALSHYQLSIGNDSPRAMDSAVDAATEYVQEQGLYPSKQAIDYLRSVVDMDELLEPLEACVDDTPAQPSMKRNLFYYLGERTVTAQKLGYGELHFDACVITSPTFTDEFTVTICEPHPSKKKVGTLFFYREPYIDYDETTGRSTERENWHPLVPSNSQNSLSPGARVSHMFSSVPIAAVTGAAAPLLSVPQPSTAPSAAPPARKRKLKGRRGPKISHDARNSASGRPYAQYTDQQILNGVIDSDLWVGELAIRLGINHEYDPIEDAIKALKPGEYEEDKPTKMFTKRVTAALKLKAKQLGIPMGQLRNQYRAAKKSALQAAKHGGPQPPLPGWVVS
ncbi:hypothetical protein Slin15195_G062950 [Septoria linicola]|uniref:Uncharacterized protein n=1 Tax=Septoria linicola TaxID=215465 RepID=A0A9Q9AYH8_9PEZI|nr:hypothetical protein Slin15195_G062950 [Septoria linicola]